MTQWTSDPGTEPPTFGEEHDGPGANPGESRGEPWGGPTQAVPPVDAPTLPQPVIDPMPGPPAGGALSPPPAGGSGAFGPPPQPGSALPPWAPPSPAGGPPPTLPSGPPLAPPFQPAPVGGPMPASSPAGSGFDDTPPPPLYPPINRFPCPAGSPPTPPRRSRKAAAAGVVVAALALGGVGFGLGRAIQDDASSPTTTAVSSSSTGVAQQTSATTAPGQSGPVTEAPTLDPSLSDEPAAAVNKAVSPAVVQIETTSGLGTGFIYDEQGYILTAAHVVAVTSRTGATSTDYERQVTVKLANGMAVKGDVLGSDLNNDVAVIKIDPIKDMPVASLALDDTPEVGSIAVAIGSPFGLDQTVTQGIVSAINRPVTSPNNNLVAMIQTDAAINSGNSGGPLVNRKGEVIGINTQIFTDTGDNAGIGFAVPIDTAYDVAQSLVAGEPIQLGYLGVRTEDPGFGTTGAMVTTVAPDSPAAAAGLQQGDVITEANGQSISSFEQLASMIRAGKPGDTMKLSVLRDQQTVELTVTLGAADQN